MLVYIRKTTMYTVEVDDVIRGVEARQTVEADMGEDPDWYLDNVAEVHGVELLLRADDELGYSYVSDDVMKYMAND